MKQRAPGVYFSRGSSRSFQSVTLVNDAALSLCLSLDRRDGVVVQFDGGAKERCGALFSSFGFLVEDLLAAQAHRDVVRREGTQYFLCERVAPLDPIRRTPAQGLAIEFEVLAGRYAATDLIDNESGEVVVQPGEHIDAFKLRTHPTLAVPFALLASDDAWLADRVFRATQGLVYPLEASLLALPTAVADELREGCLTLGPKCRAALNEEFDIDRTGERLGVFELALLWHALVKAEHETQRTPGGTVSS